MEPEKHTECGLEGLLERVLDKGVILNADLIISVADVPLIGVNLRAAIANMDKMLEYGLMTDWEEATKTVSEEKATESTGKEKIKAREVTQ